ncbi:MAG: ABC transporter ATP-binding protein [Gammaproteobacteria bacterium]|jgi:putative ABC transport system ATP-binding protein|nr:ABC transporter ATP-binding protein [Gammaproteobacteria bacterium]MBT4494994.1 ABC transporter ATP-binding protein [Gammaproteobacteria bacterium]
MIRFENICRDFKVGDETVHALKNVNQHIETGEYASIMGPSGSGKSTLLNVLGLLDTPSSGHYWLNGRDVSQLNDDDLAETRQEVIGFVFQSFHLIQRMTALENVELPMVLAGMAPEERRDRASQMLFKTGLEDRMTHRPDQLSGGQRQRVAIARSIVMEPKVLLADEPTGNLDSQSGKEVLDILEGLHAEGLTLILVTHDPVIGQRSNLHLRMTDGVIHAERRSQQRGLEDNRRAPV